MTFNGRIQIRKICTDPDPAKRFGSERIRIRSTLLRIKRQGQEKGNFISGQNLPVVPLTTFAISECLTA